MSRGFETAGGLDNVMGGTYLRLHFAGVNPSGSGRSRPAPASKVPEPELVSAHSVRQIWAKKFPSLFFNVSTSIFLVYNANHEK